MVGESGLRRATGHRLVVAIAILLVAAAGAVPAPARAQEQEFSDQVSARIDKAELGWGETATVTGSGWDPGREIKIILYAGGHQLAAPVATADGTIRATIRIPDGLASRSDYLLRVQGVAVDLKAGFVDLPLTILGPEPTFNASDQQVEWGQSVTVSGQRWEPGTNVDIAIPQIGADLGRATTDGDGTFSTSIAIPRDIASRADYFLVAIGQGIDGLLHWVPVQITVVGPPAVVSVQDTELGWGSTTRVRGELFLAGTTAQITLSPTNIPLGQVQVEADGTFDTEVRIPSDLPTSRLYLIVVSGAAADSQLALVGDAVTIVGPQPTMQVSDDTRGGRPALRVEGQRFLAGTQAAITLLPGSERLGVATIEPDGTFDVRVEVPDDFVRTDPNVVVVTGQGADHLFAFLAAEVTLDSEVVVGAAVVPPGADPFEAAPLLDDPFDLVRDPSAPSLPQEDNSANELWLGLLLLFLLVVGGWILRHALRSDLGPALARIGGRLGGLGRRRTYYS